MLLPQIRLILGTTYRDLHTEREYLLKRTIPQIKRRCEEQGVLCVVRELRWSEDPELLVRQMNRFVETLATSGTYYIGVHSELRPPATKFDLSTIISSEARSRLASVADRSMAWREIEEYLAKDLLPPESIILLGRGAGGTRSPETRTSQSSPEELDAALHCAIEDVLARVTSGQPSNSTTSYHQLYLSSRAQGALQSASYADAIVAALSSATSVVLLGDAGSGKTTSLSLATEALSRSGESVIPYVLEGADTSGQAISDHYRLSLGERVTSGQESTSGLALALSRAGDTIIALDGIEFLDQNSYFLGWLPDPLPKNIKAIATTTDEKQATALESKGWTLIRVESLKAETVQQLIAHLCWERDLWLSADQKTMICEHPLSFHPQFLITLLDELGQFGWFEQLKKNLDEYLDELSIYQLFNSAKAGAAADTSLPGSFVLSARLQHYLQSRSIVELYLKVLERLEYDFGTPQLTRILAYLGTASRGLTLQDLTALCGLTEQSIQHLFNALGSNISLRGGRTLIGNEYLQKAIEKRYLSERSVRTAVRSSLIHYLRSNESMDHTYELAIQYAAGGHSDDLKALLLKYETSSLLFRHVQFDTLSSFWKAVNAEVDQEYLAALDTYVRLEPVEDRIEHLRRVAELLLYIAKPVAAHAILSAAIDATEDDAALAADRAQLLRSLGRTLYLLARYRESESAYRASVEIFAQLGDQYEAQAIASRNLLAQLLAEGAQYAEADSLYTELLLDTEKVYGPESPELASTLSSIGLMLNAQGKYDAAISVAARARNIFVHHWGSEYPELGWCFFVFATAYRQKNELEEASRWYSLAITRFVQMHGEEHPIPLRSMYGLAVLLQKKGDLEGSIVQARKIVALRSKLLGSKHADTAAAKVLLGSVLKANGEYTEAMTLLSEGLEVFDGGVNKEHPEVARTLHELGEVYGRLQLHEKARASLSRAVAIRTKVLGIEHPDTMASTALLDVIVTASGGELVLPKDPKLARK